VFVSDLKIRDIYMDVQHLACECSSSELVKGIASEGGRGSFAGRIYVAEGAQKTDASLLNRNIVLGDKAKIYTKPTLEIYADDVKCGHGATVGQLDPEAVYYMRQRGLSKQAAERLQLLGFASEVVERFGGEAAERIAASVEQKLQTL
jgi:Fe-S cluster assembly protein SufD